MNNQYRGILSFLSGLALGFVLRQYIAQIYFVGLLLIFMIIFGQNRQLLQYKSNHSAKKQQSKYLFFALIGYLLIGVIRIFV